MLLQTALMRLISNIKMQFVQYYAKCITVLAIVKIAKLHKLQTLQGVIYDIYIYSYTNPIYN